MVQTKEKVHTKAIPRAACFPLKRIFPRGRQITTYRSKANRARDQRATMPIVRKHIRHKKLCRFTEKQTPSHITESFRLKGIWRSSTSTPHAPQAQSTQSVAQDQVQWGFDYLHRWTLHNHSGQPLPVSDLPSHQAPLPSMKGCAIYVRYSNIY